jgi:hypothetical protein
LLCYSRAMKRIILALFLFSVTMLIAGDYKMKSVAVLPIESYPAQVTTANVTVAADPYSSDEKSYKAFDVKDLNSRGYYPLHILIRNGTSNYLTIRTKDVILFTSSGEQLYTTPSAIIVDDVFGLSNKTPKKESKDKEKTKNKEDKEDNYAKGQEVDAAFKKGSPLTDFTSKELVTASLDPESVVDGFLFFYTSTPKKNLFEGSTLYIPKLEEEGTRKPVGPFTIRLDPALTIVKPSK